jgi:hypothetical protein
MNFKYPAIAVFSLLTSSALTQETSLREKASRDMVAHEAAVVAEAAAKAEGSELTAAARIQIGVIAEARIETQLAAEKAAASLQEYLDSIQVVYTGNRRPGEDLNWHVRPKPTADQYDWIVEGGSFQSQRGLGVVGSGYGDAYRASRAAGDTNIIFGVMDSTGWARVGGTWGQQGSDVLAFPGDEKASATFVGMTPTASVRLAFSSVGSTVQATGDVMAFDIGLRGPEDTFVIRANGGSDHVQLDGCWFLAPSGWGTSTNNYASGLHIDGWDTLVIRNHKWRGEIPGTPGINFREHPVAYLKSGRTSTLLEGNDMYGGNRTGFQKRPDAEYQALPTDRLMVRNNYCANYGSNHEFGDGGAVYTVWASSAGTYIYDNTATNFRFQALVISGQDLSRNFQFLPSGNQHNAVYVSGNRFIPGPLTERGTVSISSVDRIHLWGDNTFEGPVVLDSQWNYSYNGTLNGATTIHNQQLPNWDLYKYDPAIGAQRPFTPEEAAALLSN